MINQMRIYTIPPANRGVFLDRFRDHAARLMRQHGFALLAMWTADTEEVARFVYLLAWEDEAAMKDGWARFMADPEWAEIKRASSAEHGDVVLGIEDLVLEPTEFSAALAPAS